MKIKVNQGWQIRDERDGRVYGPGETLDAPKAEADQWLAAGYAQEVKTQSKTESKSTKAKTEAKSTKK